MSWRVSICLLTMAGWTALAAEPVDTSAKKPLWDELGLQSADKADHGAYRITAWKFKDATGALAGSFLIPGSVLTGNYVLSCEGKCPKNLVSAAGKLPGFASQPLPVLRTYIPSKGLYKDSQRYVVGPAGLAEAVPEIPQSAAGFRFGAEAAIGRFKAGKSDAALAIFSYPTPSMARAQLPEFNKIPGAVVKRSGPLVAVVLRAATPADAEQLLKDMEYAASVSWDQQPPLIIRPQTAAQIVLGGMELAGVVLVFCLLSGLAYAGFRVARRRFGPPNANESLIVLGLGSK